MVLTLLSCSQVMSQNPIDYVRVWICGEIGRFIVNIVVFKNWDLNKIMILLNSSFKDKRNTLWVYLVKSICSNSNIVLLKL